MSVTDGPNRGLMINALTGDNFDAQFRAFLRAIDALLQCSVKSKTLTAPPGSPTNGDRYIIAASPTGAWSGHAQAIAVWTTDNPAAGSGEWEFYPAAVGLLVFNVADSAFYGWSGSAWSALAGGGGGGATAFTGLSDVPASYSGSAGFTVKVNSGASALVFEDALFTDLADAPSSYSAQEGFAVEVSALGTGLVFSAKPFDVSVFAPGLGTNSQKLLRVKLARAVTFPASATLSQACASANATASTTFTLSKNGTSFATVNFASSSASGTWTQASPVSFAAGDLLEIDGPSTADATLANVGITLAGVRS